MDGAVGNVLNTTGKLSGYVAVIAGLIVCLCFTGIGSILLFGPDYSNTTSGVVKSISGGSAQVLIGQDTVTVSNIPEKTQNETVIFVYYTNDKPPKYSASKNSPLIGAGLISSGVVALIFGLVVMSFVSQSRTASQVVGGLTILDAIKR